MRVLVTGSADGLGHLAAAALQRAGHDVVVHVRGTGRLDAVRDLMDRGAQVVVGDLADLGQTRDVAVQAEAIGRMDAVIHNAGVYSGAAVVPVNLVAPYLLTASMERPARLVHLSTALSSRAVPTIAEVSWSGGGRPGYFGSKLLLTTLTMALARLWPDVLSNAVNPGWVPTRMGGPDAPDDLDLGHLTQEWLATSDDPRALVSGGYWHHQTRLDPPPATLDPQYQDELLDALGAHTGVRVA